MKIALKAQQTAAAPAKGKRGPKPKKKTTISKKSAGANVMSAHFSASDNI